MEENYQVYELTYDCSVPVGKTILQTGLSKQEARDLTRDYRNALDTAGVLSKGYGYELIPGST